MVSLGRPFQALAPPRGGFRPRGPSSSPAATREMRLPGYLRRCLCKRRCALPCALFLFVLYGFYTKDAAVQNAVNAEEAVLEGEVKSVENAFGVLNGVVAGGGLRPGKAALPEDHSGRGVAEAEKQEELDLVEKLSEQKHTGGPAAGGRQAQAGIEPPTAVAPPLAPLPPPPPPPPLPPPPPAAVAGMAPLTEALMSSMDEPAKRAYATSYNTGQEVYRRELLPAGPLGDAPVIVVMVHNRPLYFARVLRSLEQVKGIEKALLVVSLDYLSPEMDALVRGIKFCAVVQIFCPASAQLYAAEYPGTDPRDCAGGWDS